MTNMVHDEGAGHGFHGNQFTGGKGGQRKDASPGTQLAHAAYESAFPSGGAQQLPAAALTSSGEGPSRDVTAASRGDPPRPTRSCSRTRTVKRLSRPRTHDLTTPSCIGIHHSRFRPSGGICAGCERACERGALHL